jgi:hypothetical protein
MAQHVITEKFEGATDTCHIHISRIGVQVDWQEDGGDERAFTWEEMSDPEILVKAFSGVRVGIFVQFCKLMADVYQKRSMFQEVSW